MEGRRALIGAACALALGAVEGCRRASLPPYGQLRLHVHTDAPVPSIVSRLRIDVFRDGRWIDSRDQSLRDPTAWPVSFTVLTSETARPRTARVRLRAYREGALRDYRGERFLPPPPPGTPADALPLAPPSTDEPRLETAGVDLTPRDEPIPESAIDRLVGVTLREGEVLDVRVTLHAACAGTMADVAGDRTCVDRRGALAPVTDGADDPPSAGPWEGWLAERRARLPPPRAERFAADGTPLHDEEVVVPGGIFVLGSRERGVLFESGGRVTEAAPERVFVAPPSLLDRFEYTVARYRDALRRGFVPPEAPRANDQPGFDDVADRTCTYSAVPFVGADSREEMPLNCISWMTARALCQFDGGDLPTEALWDFAASAEGRPGKTALPWGDEGGSCEDLVYGRAPEPTLTTPCGASAVVLGPLPVDAGPRDVTPAGARGLAGSLLELVRDRFTPYDASCWAAAPFFEPVCPEAPEAMATLRGGAWTLQEIVSVSLRAPFDRNAVALDVGFRCARS